MDEPLFSMEGVVADDHLNYAEIVAERTLQFLRAEDAPLPGHVGATIPEQPAVASGADMLGTGTR